MHNRKCRIALRAPSVANQPIRWIAMGEKKLLLGLVEEGPTGPKVQSDIMGTHTTKACNMDSD